MAQQLLPCYLAVGANELKRVTAVRRLKSRLNAEFSAFNLDEREAAKIEDATELALSLNTLPFGDTFRLVIIHNAEKLAKPVSEMIVSYLANPNLSCVLMLDSESLRKNTRLYKAVAKVGARSVIECPAMSAKELPSYLKKRASAKGLILDDAAARELVSRAGESPILLDAQLQTLGEICADTRRITLQVVRDNVARTAEVKPWDFLDCVAEGNAAEALSLFALMRDTSALGLITLLVRRLRELACARSLIDRGQARDVARELKRPDWQVRRLVNSARRLTQRQLAACLAACAVAERDLKSGADADATITMLVLFVCNPKDASVSDLPQVSLWA